MLGMIKSPNIVVFRAHQAVAGAYATRALLLILLREPFVHRRAVSFLHRYQTKSRRPLYILVSLLLQAGVAEWLQKSALFNRMPIPFECGDQDR